MFQAGLEPQDPLELEFEGSVLSRAVLFGTPSDVIGREELFDGRENGRVYDEGDGLFRTTFNRDDGAFFDLGFILDASGQRALVADFGLRVGAIQRRETLPLPPIEPRLDRTWSGRMVIFDGSNVDDANVDVVGATLTCNDGTCEGQARGSSFRLDLMPTEGPVWGGGVSGGLTPADELLSARALTSPDARLLALSICTRGDPVRTTGIACAYGAFSTE